ncbi:MAG: wall associated protein, partial [Stenotrophomonas sp.]
GYTSEYLRPGIQTTTTRDGATFSSTVGALDGFGRPLSTVSSSSLGYTRSETRQYHDNTARWVLGQTARTVNVETGAETARTVFHPDTALPTEQYAFGELQMRLSYYSDGQVESVTDGNGNITIASDWRRGIPQVIGYADGFAESAAVDDLGRVTRTTDENGFSSTFAYDTMGRLAQRTWPTGDTVAWNAVGRSFERIGSAEFGLEAGHWRLTETEGNRQRRLYFDAFWRPVLEESQDLSNPQQTLSQVVRRFDRLGRKVFESYPSRSITNFRATLPGSYTGYDALSRVSSVGIDSEHGRLTTTSNYLSGLRRQTINPRGFATVESFQAWDTPGYDLPVRIDAPEGVSTQITRDVFGKPVTISRSGPDR